MRVALLLCLAALCLCAAQQQENTLKKKKTVHQIVSDTMPPQTGVVSPTASGSDPSVSWVERHLQARLQAQSQGQRQASGAGRGK